MKSYFPIQYLIFSNILINSISLVKYLQDIQFLIVKIK